MEICSVQEKCSVFIEGQKEADKYKWIESEKAGFDLGETITAAMWRLCKQIKAELEDAPGPGRKLNGRITEPSTEKLQ